MNKDEELQKLIQLKELLNEYHLSQSELKKAQDAVEKEKLRPLTAVLDYDHKNISNYINNRVGPEPQQNFFDPLYHRRVQKYKQARSIATKAYYKEYASIRQAIEKRDEEARQAKIRQLEFDVYLKAKDFHEKESAVNGITFIPKKSKNNKAISDLIHYFESGQADSIKEALNLYERDQKLESMQAQLQNQIALQKDTMQELNLVKQQIADLSLSMIEMTTTTHQLLEQFKDLHTNQQYVEEIKEEITKKLTEIKDIVSPK